MKMKHKRQAGWENPSCLPVCHYITPHITYAFIITVNRTSVIKTVSSFRATLAPVTFYNKFQNHLTCLKAHFSFTGFPLYGSKFPYLHIRFRAADLIFVAKVRAMPFLSARSCRTVPSKISISRLAEIVFGRETLHKEPCHLVGRHNQIRPGSSDATKGKTTFTH